ncbi:hypothetical protein Y032_0246g42 [Ancylostoma ceylanicum]|uniref:Integrase catalytic domain-containing protein n=1 Tax=Ancylostoma ceylanicum TaxID=53326 RepID=A0A016SDX7_9BILA|nr:hypothetical protein Y032_0246g42 [Ancylostoma ceylanicum]
MERSSRSQHSQSHRDPKVTPSPCARLAPQDSSRTNKNEDASSQLLLLAVTPSLDADIESLVRNCTTCTMLAKNPVKAELYSRPKPTALWTRTHADFAGPLDGKYYLVIVDGFSECISASATIAVMNKIFARFGNPQTLVTDNGTQFTSAPFLRFCRSPGITHVRLPPFHPQNYGQAKRFVDIFKRGLAKLKKEEPTVDPLQTFLMAYRSTLPIWTKPLVACRKLPGTQISHRARLDESVSIGSRWTRRGEDGSSLQLPPWSRFEVDHTLYVKDYRGQKFTWTPGFVVRRTGNATYTVRCGDLQWNRHVNQLLDVFDLPLFDSRADTDDSTPEDAMDLPTPPLRRSSR